MYIKRCLEHWGIIYSRCHNEDRLEIHTQHPYHTTFFLKGTRGGKPPTHTGYKRMHSFSCNNYIYLVHQNKTKKYGVKQPFEITWVINTELNMHGLLNEITVAVWVPDSNTDVTNKNL